MASAYQRVPLPADANDTKSLLGRGAFGETHRMMNKFDKGMHAVKEISVTKLKDLGVRAEDIEKEAIILQQLDHQHIVRYITCFYNSQGTIFNIVMKLIDGGSLADQIKSGAPSIKLMKKWLYETASALVYLHYEMKFLHRDIKPENILLTSRDQSIKLIDLGLASVMKSTAYTCGVGTLAYVSYEKLTGPDYDHRDDVWAVGCVFAELLTKSRLKYTLMKDSDRLALIECCMNIDSKLGDAICRMLETPQDKRCTSEELLKISTQINRHDKSIAATAAAAAAVATATTIVGWRQTSVWYLDSDPSTITLNQDGTKVAIGCMSGSIQVHSMIDRTALPHFIAGIKDQIHALCFSPDGTRLAVGFSDCVDVFDSETGNKLLSYCLEDFSSSETYSSMPDSVLWILFTSDGSKMVLGRNYEGYLIVSVDGSVLPSEDVNARYGGWLSQDGKILVVSDGSEYAVIDDLVNVRHTIDCRDQMSSCMTSDGSKIVACLRTGFISVLDTSTCLKLCTIPSENNTYIYVSANESLYAWSNDTLMVWPTLALDSAQIITEGSGRIRCCVGKDSLAVSGSYGQAVTVWEA